VRCCWSRIVARAWQDALPPEYQKILAIVRDAGGPVTTKHSS